MPNAPADPTKDAPVLESDGRLTFVDNAALVRIHDAFLIRGGLPVRPVVPLQPLANVTVVLGPEKVSLDCQVVVIQGEITVLRLLTSLPASVATFIRESKAPKDTSPPTLNDTVLEFKTLKDFSGARASLMESGLVLAQGAPETAERNLTIGVGGHVDDTRLSARLTPLGDGLEVQFSDPGALGVALFTIEMALSSAPVPAPATTEAETSQADMPAETSVDTDDGLPVLDGTVLRFGHVDDVKVLKTEILQTLQVSAHGDGTGAGKIYLAIGADQTNIGLACEFEPGVDGRVTLNFLDVGTLAGAMRTLISGASRNQEASPPASAPSPATKDLTDALASYLASSSSASPSPSPAPSPAPTLSPSAAVTPALRNPFAAKGDAAPTVPEATEPAAPLAAPVRNPFASAKNASAAPSNLFDPATEPRKTATMSDEELAEALGPRPVVDAAFDAAPDVTSDIFDIGAPANAPRLSTPPSTVAPSVPTPAPTPTPAPAPAPPAIVAAAPPSAPLPTSEIAARIATPASATLAPARLTSTALIFRRAALAQVRFDFERLGMTWADVDNDVEIRSALTLRIELDGERGSIPLPAVAMPGPPGIALVRVLDLASAAASLASLAGESPGQPPVETAVAMPAPPQAELAAVGLGREDLPPVERELADAVEDSAPEEAVPATPTGPSCTLSGTVLAFASVENLNAARAEIESAGALAAECSVAPPQTIELDASVGGTRLGVRWSAATHAGATGPFFVFDNPKQVLAAIDQHADAIAQRDADGDDGDDAAGLATPPVLTGTSLAFSHANFASLAAGEVETHGAILVTPAEKLTGAKAVNIRFQVSDRTLDEAFSVRVQAVQDGKAIAVFDAADVERAAETLRCFLASPSDTVGISAQDISAAALPESGRINNPKRVSELLALPVTTPPTAEDIRTPSTPVLLRLLMATEGVLEIRLLSLNAEKPTTFYLVDGREVRSASSVSRLAEDISFGEGRFVLEPLSGPAPNTKKRMLTVSLIGEVVRTLVSKRPTAELAGSFPNADMTPLLSPRGERLLDAIGLSASQTRFARQKMKGFESAAALAQAQRVPALAWELLYALEIMGGLTWSTASKRIASGIKMTPLERIWAEMQVQDAFDLLGLHWSSPPRSIAPAREKAEEQYGPRSDAAKSEPAVANDIFAKLCEAHNQIKDAPRRRTYRKETFSLKWTQQADLILEHAKLAAYRGDLAEARDLLEGLLDFSQNDEATALLKRLRNAGLK